MKVKLLAAVVSLLAFDSAVAAVTVNDPDGYDRESKYTEGVVARIVTDSLNSRSFNGWVFRTGNWDKCPTGQVYDEITGEFIATIGTSQAGPNAYSIDSISMRGEFTEEQLQRTRVLSLDCESEEGKKYTVKHKIPAVPSITWETSLAGVGEWNTPNCTGQSSHCGGRGWYDQISYTSSLHINNGTKDGYCSSEITEGLYSRLFNNYDSTPLFHTNHYALKDHVYNYSGAGFMQKVICKNPAGTTERIQVWEVAGENDINLVVDQTIYR